MLQIQPVYSNIEQYAELAQAENLRFELLEPAFGFLKDREDHYARTGLVKSLHGAFIDINPASSDSDFRLLSEKKCRESCHLAEYLGAENVVLHSSCAPVLRGAYLDLWLKRSADFFHRLSEETSVRILIENSFDLDPEPIQKLMALCGSQKFGVCLDLGHANYSRGPVSGWVDALKPHIRYLHLSDNLGVYDDHLTLGAGTVDWQLSASLLRDLPADTPMTLEVGNLQNIRASVSFLRENHLFGR